MDFKELVSPTLTDLFIKEMQRMILSKELPIGEKLPSERELAQKMKVSTAVVNSGIRRLSEKGFVRIVPRKGVFIADYLREGNMATLDSILEYNKDYHQESILESLVAFRRTYEVKVTEDACTNRSEEDLHRLALLLDRMESETRNDVLSDLAYEFHHEIAIASDDIIHALLIATFKVGYVSSYRSVLDIGRFLPEYRSFFKSLYEMIRKKDRKGASDLVLSSIDNWEKFLKAKFDESPKCETGERLAPST